MWSAKPSARPAAGWICSELAAIAQDVVLSIIDTANTTVGNASRTKGETAPVLWKVVEHNGSSLDVLRAVCPEEHRDYIFDGEVIPWHRLREFQQVSLARIAELVVAASAGAPDAGPVRELQVVGGLAWASLRFASPVSVYASPHNPQVEGVVATLQEHFPGMVLGVEHATAASAWLLFLTADCFEGDRGERLAGELQAKLERGGDGCALLMVYDPMANPFGDIIDHTFKHAPALMQLGLFDALAIEWRSGALGEVSVRMVAQRLGARRWAPSQLCRSRAVRPHTSLGWLRPRLRNGRLIERAVSLRGETDAPSDGLAVADVEEDLAVVDSEVETGAEKVVVDSVVD